MQTTSGSVLIEDSYRKIMYLNMHVTYMPLLVFLSFSNWHNFRTIFILINKRASFFQSHVLHGIGNLVQTLAQTAVLLLILPPRVATKRHVSPCSDLHPSHCFMPHVNGVSAAISVAGPMLGSIEIVSLNSAECFG